MKKRVFLGVCAIPILWGCSTPSRKTSAVLPTSQRYPNNPVERQNIVMQAMAMLDRSYTYGGKKLHTGFDCSGLVSFVYKESAGIVLAGSAAQMAALTKSIEPSQTYPGDLVFFNTLGPSYSHVGIYIGSGKFIHAANERTGVKSERLNNSYWMQRFEGYRTLFA